MVSKLSKETQVALECMLRKHQKVHPSASWCSWPIMGVSRFTSVAWTLHAADGQTVVIGDSWEDEECDLLTRAAQETEAYDRGERPCAHCKETHAAATGELCPEPECVMAEGHCGLHWANHADGSHSEWGKCHPCEFDAPRGARSRAAQRHAEYLAKRKVEQDTHADVNAFIDTIRDREAKREALMTEMQNAMRFELGKSYLPDSRRQEASAEWSRRVREGVKALKPALQVCVQPELEEWE